MHKATGQISPTRVVILGAGTVGGGVLERLLAMPEQFSVVGVADRSCSRQRRHFGKGARWSKDPWAALELNCDVVVELLGGIEPAQALIRTALNRGRHVVTANKAVVATNPDLDRRVHCSAAVGGAAPFLETVRRVAAMHGIRSLRGVLNGTTNFILEELRRGCSFECAVESAVAQGLAESDPTGDVCGQDAAYKLRLLCRAAYGVEPNIDARIQLEDFNSGVPLTARRRRQVAEASTYPESRLRGSVSLVEVDESDPLFQLPDAWNALVITDLDGREHIVRGIGAGRYPTAESVLSDLWRVRDQLATRNGPGRVRRSVSASRVAS